MFGRHCILVAVVSLALVGSAQSIPNSANFCVGPVDAVMLAAGKTYFFKGDYFVLLNYAGTKIVPGYPRRIAEQWPGLTGGLDAAMAWSNGYTYFFKGGFVWTYKGQTKVSVLPIPNRFRFKVLSDVSAAFVWKNNRAYIFKGAQYYRLSYDRTRHDSAYPKSVHLWALTGPIDAVFRWRNGKTYFFIGDKYYRYNDFLNKMESWGALSTGKLWFGCASRKKRAVATN